MARPASPVRLGRGAEFDLIRRFVGGGGALPPEVRVGPGDDAAVLEGGWVVSTDLSVEGVHFRRDWLGDAEIGWRAGAGALSDMAAMAARPVALLVSMAAPAGGAFDLEAVQAGLREVGEGEGAAVIGGDLSRSPGPLVLDVVVLGRAEAPLLRAGARPGDEVWVSGWLGAAAAAVRCRLAGAEPAPELHEAYARPRPRVREALRLAEEGVAAALIDLSDGLAGDAGHLAAAGGVRITLDPRALPVAPAAREALGAERALEAALHGGEDYELCFAARPGAVDPERLAERVGVALTRVGWAGEGEGVWLLDAEGGERPVPRGGYDHWATP
ncbi:MAG TPA: thiamine-phosphate kinase [Longimicrobiales bacterium]|nr:thiamine-phosphate kinase [Longimicrobiales bacterium]